MKPRANTTERLRMQEPEPVFTVRQIAALDRVSEKTVRRAIAAGELEIIRVGPAGHSIRIPAAAHRAYRARSF